MSARKRWRAVPAEGWPESDRRTWARATRGWPAHRLKQARTAYGQLLAYGEPDGVDQATIAAFAEAVAWHRPPQSARTTLRGLADALVVLRPEEPWGWLHEAARDAIRAGRPQAAPKKRPGPTPTRRVAMADWPDDHRARWITGFASPAEPVVDDPYAAALAAVTAAWPDGGTSDEVPGTAMGKPARHPSSWRPATCTAAERGWGRWLAWAGEEGGAAAPEAVTRDRVARYVDGLAARGCAPKSITAYVQGLRFALRVLAPDGDWTWLSRQATILQSHAVPLRDKAIGLRPIEELAALGTRLMAEAVGQPLTLSAATLYRDGLYIALLAWRPKRISNIGEMRIGRELVLDQTGEPVSLLFDRTKNNDPSESTVPVVLRPCVRAYLDRFRPLLDGQAGDALWVSNRGAAMAVGSLAAVLRDHTKAAWGKGIGPHYVRTMYATSMGATDPRALAQVSIMLDHRNSQTVEIYRALATSTNASHALDRMTTGIVEATLARRKKERQRTGRKRPPARGG
ncbi:hypothetical protein [Inquilinus sp. CAU 1745]|uniref:hypothetical protein n=1 Tax=Inquilinus sp. CAU 1745 TaxID=3140369 RepID=UPI00325BAD81